MKMNKKYHSKTKNYYKRNYYKGLLYEYIALIMLIFKGYKLLHRRFKTKVGEIDLIMEKGNTICFIEVKGRSTESLAGESIHFKNRDRIINAAKVFLNLKPKYYGFNMRFDAMLFYKKKYPLLPFTLLKTTHIKNAW